MPSIAISVRTRRRLWIRSGGYCAFPDCNETLLEPIEGTDDDTNVGVECHIVSRNDSPAVARSVSSLTPAEKQDFASLIDDRHGFSNLVLMCARHAVVVDDPHAGFDVARVVQMKRAHEATMNAKRSDTQRRADDLVLRYAAIIDGWQHRVGLDEWQTRYGLVFGDGHPRMDAEHLNDLSEARRWMFSRVLPGTEPALEQAFENFRYVAQDLQITFEEYPHEHLALRGIVAPVRFYNDAGWRRRVGDQRELDRMYEWYANLLEDLALELTRAANLVCEAVRQSIDPRYRLEDGLVVLESGPYMDFRTRLHRPRYQASDGWSPYPGLRQFLIAREQRDEHRGKGQPPEHIRLPGDSRSA